MSKTWFIASGMPAADSNVKALIDGEKAWQEVLTAVNAAENTIHLAFWMMHLDQELDRPASLEFKDPKDRDKNTLHNILLNKSDAGVKIRILLWILPTIPATELELLKLLFGSPFIDPLQPLKQMLAPPSILATLDIRIIQYALLKKVEVLLEPHPTSLIGSWHQKTIIVDNKIAFVGGMNAKENDWDAYHGVYDYRRTPHTTTGPERTAMKSKKELTKFPPRHDFMTAIEGGVVKDVQNNFIDRWNQAIDDKRFFFRSLVKIAKSVLSSGGGSGKKAQIVRTMPRYTPTPMGEKGCLEAYQLAIRNAEQYIYIEDQYFRSQMIAQELANACKKNPKLILIVVTPPDYLALIEQISIGFASPSTYWTAEAFNTIAKAVPNFCLFQLIADDTDIKGDVIYVDVDTHAKLMIIDDEWYTIGSCNINERGFIDEGEMNVCVNDPAEALRLRKYLWSEHMQVACPNDIVSATRLWYDHAKKNYAAKTKKTALISRIHPFAQAGPLLPIVPKTWF